MITLPGMLKGLMGEVIVASALSGHGVNLCIAPKAVVGGGLPPSLGFDPPRIH
jgi:hypothetical protein